SAGGAIRAGGHRAVRTGAAFRSALQQRRAALAARPSFTLAPAHRRAGRRRPAGGADADERRPPLAPDRLRGGPLARIPPPAGRLREAPAAPRGAAICGVAAPSRVRAAARAAADLRPPAR